MAFVDALIDRADVDIVLVDRRHAARGHWWVSKRIRAVTGRIDFLIDR